MLTISRRIVTALQLGAIALTLTLLPGVRDVSAQTLVNQPAPDAVAYTPVIVDGRKLKSTLLAALNQFPGEEIIVATDVNASIVSGAFVFTNAFTYNLAEGFAKPPRVDGLKATNFANFKVPTAGVYEPARVVTVSFVKPVTEFGISLIPGRVDIQTVQALDVAVNGAYVGRATLVGGVVQYVGVTSATGINSVTLTPVVDDVPTSTGAWIGGRVFIK